MPLGQVVLLVGRRVAPNGEHPGRDDPRVDFAPWHVGFSAEEVQRHGRVRQTQLVLADTTARVGLGPTTTSVVAWASNSAPHAVRRIARATEPSERRVRIALRGHQMLAAIRVVPRPRGARRDIRQTLKLELMSGRSRIRTWNLSVSGEPGCAPDSPKAGCPCLTRASRTGGDSGTLPGRPDSAHHRPRKVRR